MGFCEVLVTVVVPVYNGAAFVRDTLESVRNQTHGRLECIVVDDGSTDNSGALVQEWIAADGRFSYTYQSNQGLSAARNAGLRLAKGAYIQFLDADDVLLPSKLEDQLNFMAPSGSLVSYTDYSSGNSADIYQPHRFKNIVPLRPNGKIFDFVERWEVTLSIPPHSFLFSASLFREKGIRFDPSLPNHEDFDCWLNILRVYPQIDYLDKKLCIYRITDGSMSKKMKLMGEGFLQVIDKQLQLPDEPAGIRKALRKKRLQVLKGYNRIDLMTAGERILLFRHISTYYFRRALEKAGLR